MKPHCGLPAQRSVASPLCEVTLARAPPVRTRIVAALSLIVVAAAAQTTNGRHDLSETVHACWNWAWPVYFGDQARGQDSPLAQINATNVHRFQPAWVYWAGDATERSTMYSNPLVVCGVLYAVAPSLNAVALDAPTGERIWLFDPSVHNNGTVIRLRH